MFLQRNESAVPEVKKWLKSMKRIRTRTGITSKKARTGTKSLNSSPGDARITASAGISAGSRRGSRPGNRAKQQKARFIWMPRAAVRAVPGRRARIAISLTDSSSPGIMHRV